MITYNKEIRKQLGMTQSQLAKELGLETITISNWDQGLNKPSAPALKLIEIMLSQKK